MEQRNYNGVIDIFYFCVIIEKKQEGLFMITKEFSVVSDFDGIELKGTLFEPENTPKGIIQFVYGMCEIKYRYEDLASFFAQNGYIAAVYDHRGHGYCHHYGGAG